jgi:Variant SH3 domain
VFFQTRPPLHLLCPPRVVSPPHLLFIPLSPFSREISLLHFWSCLCAFQLEKVKAVLERSIKALGGTGKVQRAKAKYAFAGSPDDSAQLPLKAGEVVLVLMADNDEWWLGKTAGGRQGFFPRKFTQLVKEDTIPELKELSAAAAPEPKKPASEMGSKTLTKRASVGSSADLFSHFIWMSFFFLSLSLSFSLVLSFRFS